MDNVLVFDPISRSDSRPARHQEDRFTFYNRAGGPVFARLRGLVEEWVEAFPAESRSEIRSRLRSRSDGAFAGAFWELYLFQVLTRLGFDVLLHPRVPGTTRRPDFLVHREGEPGFYLEATLAGLSRAEESAKKRLATIIDVVNDIDSPDFFLELTVRRQGPVPLSTRRLRHDLERWLRTLDADRIIAAGSHYRRSDPFVWDEAGWQLRFRPIAKSPGRRGLPGRAIGVMSTGATFIDTTGRLRRAVREKGGRYGVPDRPYLLAVLLEDFGLDREDVCDALFGSTAYGVDPESATPPSAFRQTDGSWAGPHGPQYRRLSGVLVGVNVAPHNVTRAAPELWLNPWATRPLSDRLAWTALVPDPQGGLEEHVASGAPGDLLGLPADWPGPEDPFSGTD